jgi:hypothetical protein
MNTHMSGSAPHLDEVELLRLIDEDGDEQWRADKERHITGCQQCARELEKLAADGALVREWLGNAAFEADLPPAQHRSPAAPASAQVRRPAGTQQSSRGYWLQSTWLRAAAILLMIAAPVAAIPGLRAWISDAVTGGAPPAEVRTLAFPPDVADEAAIVRFVPQPGVFVVAVDAPQRDGVLHVRRTLTGQEAILETAPQPGDPVTEPVFAETSLRLRNAPESASSYVLVLPPSVTTVSITIAGAEITRLSGTTLEAGTAVPLRLR